jgi:hypothetical protein
MNFLVFWPFAFIISKKIRLHLFELIKDEAALKLQYPPMVYDRDEPISPFQIAQSGIYGKSNKS